MSGVSRRIAAFLKQPKAIPRVPLLLALLGAASFILVKAAIYIGSPAPPFAYYYDLGVNAIATSYMVHAFASWKDLSDNLGWVSYGDVPNFYFNPELTYLILVPLAKLFHNVWFTIKTVQTLQELVAFGGAALLYASFSKSRIWASVAGMLYAILPATALQVRGNIDIGWAIVLTPFALATSIRLVRRFGAAALPLCGLLLSLCGFCFAVEYLFITTLPSYVFAIVLALQLRSTSRASTSAFAVLGFLCIFALGGYFILPTLGGRQFFTDPAARTAVLQNGSLLDLFSESWYGLLALTPREFLISQYSQFNAVTRLGGIIPATVLLWVAAISTAASAVRGRRLSNVSGIALAVGCVLLVLSLGSSIPLGTELWALLRGVPGFALVRTPDRFTALPLVLIVIAAVAALQKLSQRAAIVSRAIALVVPALAIALFLNFDFSEHWLTYENNVSRFEPALDDVNARVAVAGGRTLSYAVVRGGSEFYTPSYGVPTPTIWYFWDVASHYHDDGLQGYGIFRRANVHTIVATPDWSDFVSLPISSEIDNDFPGRTLVANGDGVIVKQIGARAPVNEMTSACVYGGPGLLDAAAALPALDAAAYVSPSAVCSRAVFLNYEPGPEGYVNQFATWDAGTLFGKLPALLDADYAFNIGRLFINDAWYRNSIDGDEALSNGGARIISTPASVTLPLGPARLRGDETLEIHLASRRRARITIAAEGGRRATIEVIPRRGVHWYAIPLRDFHGAHALRLTVEVCAGSALCDRSPWDGVALDRVAIVRGGAQEPPGRPATSAVLFSIPALVAERPQLSNGSNASPTALRPSSTDGIFREAHSDEPLVAVGGNGTVRYRWTGPSGQYVVAAFGSLRGAGATIALEAGTGRGRCCRVTSAYDASTETQEALDLAPESQSANAQATSSPVNDSVRERKKHSVGVLLRTRLVRGGLITVTLSYPMSTGGYGSGRVGGAALSALTVSPVLPEAPQTSETPGHQTFALNAQHLARTLSSERGVDFQIDRASGADAAFLEHRFSPSVDAQSASLRVTSQGNGEATARLECDGYSAVRTIVPPLTFVSVSGGHLRHCRTRIEWLRGSLSLNALKLDLLGDRIRDARANIWIPSGTYSLEIMQNGAHLRAATLLLDGHPARQTSRFERAGYHDLTLKNLTVRDRVLALVATQSSLRRSARLETQQLSTFDWRVRVSVPGTLEVASYPDGNWRLDSVTGSMPRAAAVRCDLIDTCFSNVPAGRYRLHHVWPASLRAGMLVTCLAIVIAVLPFVYAMSATRRRRRSLRLSPPGDARSS